MRFLMMFVVGLFMTMATVNANAAACHFVGGKEFYAEYMYDFAVDGGAVSTIDLSAKANACQLPTNAKVLSVHTEVLTAFTSGGSATVSVGDVGSSARYLSLTAFDNAAYSGLKALSSGIPHAVASANAGKVSISIAVAALTAGKMRLVVRGYVPKQ